MRTLWHATRFLKRDLAVALEHQGWRRARCRSRGSHRRIFHERSGELQDGSAASELETFTHCLLWESRLCGMWFPPPRCSRIAKRHAPLMALFFCPGCRPRAVDRRLLFRGRCSAVRFGIWDRAAHIGSRLVLAQPFIDDLRKRLSSVRVRNLTSATSLGRTPSTEFRGRRGEPRRPLP